MHIVSGLGADERAFLDFPFDLACAYLYQLLQLNRAFDDPGSPGLQTKDKRYRT